MTAALPSSHQQQHPPPHFLPERPDWLAATAQQVGAGVSRRRHPARKVRATPAPDNQEGQHWRACAPRCPSPPPPCRSPPTCVRGGGAHTHTPRPSRAAGATPPGRDGHARARTRTHAVCARRGSRRCLHREGGAPPTHSRHRSCHHGTRPPCTAPPRPVTLWGPRRHRAARRERRSGGRQEGWRGKTRPRHGPSPVWESPNARHAGCRVRPPFRSGAPRAHWSQPLPARPRHGPAVHPRRPPPLGFTHGQRDRGGSAPGGGAPVGCTPFPPGTPPQRHALPTAR